MSVANERTALNIQIFEVRRLALALAAALPTLALAAPGADSSYRTDAQTSHVEDATSRGISQVNMITCVMSAMRPDALVNQGDYIALVDQGKCDPESRSSSSRSGSDNAGSNAPSYMTATVNASRTSNTQPMRVRTWVDEKNEDFAATIHVNISASEAPSASNPYGVFRLDYCGKGETGPCMMRGFLEGSTEGISYFELEGGGGMTRTKALRLTSTGSDSGSGRLSFEEQGQPMTYSFAYNATYFRRSDGTNDQCFSRDASDPDAAMSVWRYGMYDADSGDRVTRRSGFPIEFTGNDGMSYHGHMGYWGLWLPADAPPLVSGGTVQRVEYQSGQQPTKTDYTVVRAEGRLLKYSKQTKTLAEIDKIRFNTWIWQLDGFFDGAVANRQYEMYWDEAAGAFKASGIIECGQNQCETRTFDVERTVPATYFASIGGMRGWSNALGGELFIPLAGLSGAVASATLQVIYRTQDLVYPAQMPATLYCLRECPTAASIAAFFAPDSQASSPFIASTFNLFGPADAAVGYVTNASLAMLRDASGASLTFTDREALMSRPQYQNGLRTGRLFTNLDDARCNDDATKFCDHKIESIDTYYQWETGPNQWNQFAAVRDASGNIVMFDAPLQVSYAVPQGAAFGPYAGKSIVLQYGGFGELWGIPGHCVSRLTNERVSCETPESRYVPAFVIPFDEVLGRLTTNGNAYLAKWLDREIRFARKDPLVCAAAGVNLPATLTLPSADGLSDPSDPASAIYIGSKPVVADAPRVIHGEVKY
jgi:hypothetical protein